MTFTIDTDNNIAAHAGPPAGAENMQSFANWPNSPLIGPARAWSKLGTVSRGSLRSTT
jgi:hypothetical protein